MGWDGEQPKYEDERLLAYFTVPMENFILLQEMIRSLYTD